MCRSIKKLRRPEEPPTPDEITAAALQFVRKISGFHKPSKANQASFDQAVAEIAGSSYRLLAALNSVPKSTTNESASATCVHELT